MYKPYNLIHVAVVSLRTYMYSTTIFLLPAIDIFYLYIFKIILSTFLTYMVAVMQTSGSLSSSLYRDFDQRQQETNFWRKAGRGRVNLSCQHKCFYAI